MKAAAAAAFGGGLSLNTAIAGTLAAATSRIAASVSLKADFSGASESYLSLSSPRPPTAQLQREKEIDYHEMP